MRIDVHAHYFPDEYLDLLKRFGDDTTDGARGLGAGGSQAELEARFELMKAANVQMQLLSVSPQLPSFEDRTSAIEGARMANNLYADLVRRYPRRFAALAALPLPHMEAALAEMSR
ncbi:MAG: amidohydrolase family protein, partial [Ktedonobacteraceae bacterium]|nr:amidohydrolase family protein [Ktedonobacteraceae bacterium]